MSMVYAKLAINEYDDLKRKADAHDVLVIALREIIYNATDEQGNAVIESSAGFVNIARAALAKAGV
jgi:hypothetical protein